MMSERSVSGQGSTPSPFTPAHAALEFIKIDPKADEAHLIEKFEKDTDTKVQIAHDTRILIELMVYYANLIKAQVNDACKLNLVEHSRAPILDFLGNQKNCPRLEDEEDKDYIQRILLSPEGFSVAGPELAYIYFTKSVDSLIKDVQCEVPEDDIKIKIGETETVMTTNEITTALFNIVCNYKEGEVEITLNQALEAGSKIKVTVPHPYSTFLHILTQDGTEVEGLLDKVSDALKPVKPLCDYPLPQFAKIEEFAINGKVYLRKNADEETVKKNVNELLNKYLSGVNLFLKKSVVKNHIVSYINSIDGVFDFKVTKPTSNMLAKIDTAYKGTIGNITYERVTDE